MSPIRARLFSACSMRSISRGRKGQRRGIVICPPKIDGSSLDQDVPIPNWSLGPVSSIPSTFRLAVHKHSLLGAPYFSPGLPAPRNHIAPSVPDHFQFENPICMQKWVLANSLGQSFAGGCFGVLEFEHVFQLFNFANSNGFFLVSIVCFSYWVIEMIQMESNSSSACRFFNDGAGKRCSFGISSWRNLSGVRYWRFWVPSFPISLWELSFNFNFG